MWTEEDLKVVAAGILCLVICWEVGKATLHLDVRNLEYEPNLDNGSWTHEKVHRFFMKELEIILENLEIENN